MRKTDQKKKAHMRKNRNMRQRTQWFYSYADTCSQQPHGRDLLKVLLVYSDVQRGIRRRGVLRRTARSMFMRGGHRYLTMNNLGWTMILRCQGHRGTPFPWVSLVSFIVM